jgi:N-acylneuraminate cytidylyltransferase
MVDKMGVLAIIPARAGSKSIPRKNVALFGGHPLLAYSIAAAAQAKHVDRIVVSTDDQEIARIAREYGAEAPFIRPANLAQDNTRDLPVFEHALAWLEQHDKWMPEILVHLRPTSPLRPEGLVDQAIDLIRGNPEADSVRAVVPSGQNPYKMWTIDENGRLQPLIDDGMQEPYNMPRQELPQTYWQTGHIDVIRRSTILEKRSMTGEIILPLQTDPSYTVDIDTQRDWQRAELYLKSFELPLVRPGSGGRPLPADLEWVILDFDGVMTDNRVWVDEDGREAVAASRADGWGLAQLRQRGINILVLSSETNPVVRARAEKLGLEVIHGADDKAAALMQFMAAREIKSDVTVFVGNDVNDVPCFSLVASAVVVADAHEQARIHADQILTRPGGHGAVREFCDLVLSRMAARESDA